jgi:hypothetical protein
MVERPRCPTHVEQAALEPCTRCGGYFCSSCVGDAALDHAPASGRCPPCERLTRIAAPPIGGWLVFSGLTAFLSTLAPNESLVLLISALLFSDRAKRTFVAR